MLEVIKDLDRYRLTSQPQSDVNVTYGEWLLVKIIQPDGAKVSVQKFIQKYKKWG